ncbi:glycerol-3-phosphate 1-O-acyltransferase PlsY [Castellaniella sp.]|uniref:glycerol-3-phosphate 1-O-acyltransferase PlsY n=1 Tax=Castellaniella sp. TaxID=1955812 RepID=UPI00356A7E4E
MTSLLSASALLAVLLAAYLLGSVSFAVLVSKAMGLQDPRSFGSHNPGATNVLRGGNKSAAILTLLGDAAKGWLAVFLAAAAVQQGWLTAAAVPIAGLGAFLGHLYPIFLRFRGGKGVATALGVLLGLHGWLALAVVLTWLLVAAITRYSSLAAILAAIFAPFYYILGNGVAWRVDTLTASVIVLISVLLLARHQANISRLLAGKEGKIGASRKAPAAAPTRGKRRRP